MYRVCLQILEHHQNFIPMADFFRHTFIFNTVPQSSKAHELLVHSLHIMRDLLLPSVFLQPLIEALRHDDTSFLLLHGVPHPTIYSQRIISCIDCLHNRSIIRVPLRPKGYQS